MGKVLRLYGIGRVFESSGGIITFYLCLFTSFSKSFCIVLLATYSVNINFRDYSYMLIVDRMNISMRSRGCQCHTLLHNVPRPVSCIMHECHTHALCMTQGVVRYVKIPDTFSQSRKAYTAVCCQWYVFLQTKHSRSDNIADSTHFHEIAADAVLPLAVGIRAGLIVPFMPWHRAPVVRGPPRPPANFFLSHNVL